MNTSSSVKPPDTVRRLQTPAALALADLTSIFGDLTVVVRCCEQILSALTESEGDSSDLVVESLWTTALLSYRRCFSSGRRGVSLSEDDLMATGVKGDVVAWHHMLEKLRCHYVDAGTNPRESFVVGVSQDAGGNPNGIAITSAAQVRVDDATVRQTGQLACELTRLIDERIKNHQERVYAATRSMSKSDINSLAVVEVSYADSTGDGENVSE